MSRLFRALVLALFLLSVYVPLVGAAPSDSPPGFPKNGSNIQANQQFHATAKQSSSGSGAQAAVYFGSCYGTTHGWASSSVDHAVGWAYQNCSAPAVYQSMTVALYRCGSYSGGICYNATWLTQMGPTCWRLGWGDLWCPPGTGVYTQAVYQNAYYVELTQHWATGVGGGWSSSSAFWLWSV